MSSIEDIINLIKQTDSSRADERARDKEVLATERAQDKRERAEEISSLTQTISGLIKNGVKEEVESAIRPIQEAQSSLAEEQNKLAQTVTILQEQLAALKAGSLPNLPDKTPTAMVEESPEVFATPDPDDHDESAKIVRAARKIVGFSPITKDHIEHAKLEYNIDDDFEAKKAAVKDLLYFEMKIPVTKIQSMKMKRVFAPANQPKNDPDRLYVEFEEESSVHHIYSYAHNLSVGIKLHIYIPHSFFDRFEAIDSIAYKIRKGPGNFKTKTQFGSNDLILYKKGPLDLSWNIVPMEALPPVNLAPPKPQTNSPPPGRPRTMKRKERSPLHDSGNKRSKSSPSPVSEETTSEVDAEVEQKKKDEPTASSKDSLN